jgi:ATP-dependent DNA ligase
MMKALPKLGFMLIGYDASDENLDIWFHRTNQYIMEPKVDDIRMMFFFLNGTVRVQTRGYLEKSANYPHLQEFYDKSLEGTVLDGGLLAGVNKFSIHRLHKSNFPLMISINGSLPERAIAIQEKYGKARYVAWDILMYRGRPTVKLPFEARRELLEKVGKDSGITVIKQWTRQYGSLYAQIIEDGGEGVVLKKKSSLYVYGRSDEWIRFKHFEDAYLVLTGESTVGLGKYSDLVGSIEVADPAKPTVPLTTVSGMTDSVRVHITTSSKGFPVLKPEFKGRRVLIRYNPWKGAEGAAGFRHPRILHIEGLEDV